MAFCAECQSAACIHVVRELDAFAIPDEIPLRKDSLELTLRRHTSDPDDIG